jgi:hypothetical protein
MSLSDIAATPGILFFLQIEDAVAFPDNKALLGSTFSGIQLANDDLLLLDDQGQNFLSLTAFQNSILCSASGFGVAPNFFWMIDGRNKRGPVLIQKSFNGTDLDMFPLDLPSFASSTHQCSFSSRFIYVWTSQSDIEGTVYVLSLRDYSFRAVLDARIEAGLILQEGGFNYFVGVFQNGSQSVRATRLPFSGETSLTDMQLRKVIPETNASISVLEQGRGSSSCTSLDSCDSILAFDLLGQDTFLAFPPNDVCSINASACGFISMQIRATSDSRNFPHTVLIMRKLNQNWNIERTSKFVIPQARSLQSTHFGLSTSVNGCTALSVMTWDSERINIQFFEADLAGTIYDAFSKNFSFPRPDAHLAPESIQLRHVRGSRDVIVSFPIGQKHYVLRYKELKCLGLNKTENEVPKATSVITQIEVVGTTIASITVVFATTVVVFNSVGVLTSVTAGTTGVSGAAGGVTGVSGAQGAVSGASNAVAGGQTSGAAEFFNHCQFMVALGQLSISYPPILRDFYKGFGWTSGYIQISSIPQTFRTILGASSPDGVTKFANTLEIHPELLFFNVFSVFLLLELAFFAAFLLVQSVLYLTSIFGVKNEAIRERLGYFRTGVCLRLMNVGFAPLVLTSSFQLSLFDGRIGFVVLAALCLAITLLLLVFGVWKISKFSNSELEEPRVLLKYGGFYSDYKIASKFFFVVLLSKKLCYNAVLSIFRKAAWLQSSFLLVISFVYLMVLIKIRPHKDSFHFKIVLANALIALLHALLAFGFLVDDRPENPVWLAVTVLVLHMSTIGIYMLHFGRKVFLGIWNILFKKPGGKRELGMESSATTGNDATVQTLGQSAGQATLKPMIRSVAVEEEEEEATQPTDKP